jgi:hypothetical protein
MPKTTSYDLVQSYGPTTSYQERPGTGMPPRKVTTTRHEVRDTDGTVLATIVTTNGDHTVHAGKPPIGAVGGHYTRDWHAAVRDAYETAALAADVDEDLDYLLRDLNAAVARYANAQCMAPAWAAQAKTEAVNDLDDIHRRFGAWIDTLR